MYINDRKSKKSITLMQYNNLKSDKRTDEIKPKITNVDITFLKSFT
jgi:hypothetical protein